jgi:feruloyl-CoA synthase
MGEALFASPGTELRAVPDGGWLLSSGTPLAEHEGSVGEMLRRWAGTAGDRVLVGERDAAGAWRRVTYAEARCAADAIAQALLDRGLGPQRPVAVLSGNSVDHALLMLGCFTAGVPIVPVSAAYSLQSRDFAKLRQVLEIASPALVYVTDARAFVSALATLDPEVEVVAGEIAASDGATPFTELLNTSPGPDVELAFAAVGPDTVAKVLFTSGSTGGPKGVITTHRMLCSNQQAMAQVWPFLRSTPPILVDWLPWSHTFGGSHDFNMVLKSGGSLYIDAGRPAPGLLDATVRNLRDVSPTVYFNVPAGFAALLPALEADDELAARFFARLQVIFYAGASLSADLWERLRRLSSKFAGTDVAMTTSWGATETAPAVTSAHFPLDEPGNIGVPLPGVQVKLTPVGAKLELRVKGPNVTRGYVGRPDLTAAAFDKDGFYRTGDAGTLVDPDDGSRGIVFAGRIAEEFKLATGTWVSAGSVRTTALAAVDGLLQDAVVTGHDCEYLGLLAWINAGAAQRILPASVDAGDPAAVACCGAVVEALRRGLGLHNARAGGSSSRIARVLLLTEAPSLDAGEITDKGYINQRAVLDRRDDDVERLYAPGPAPGVIEIPATAPVPA